jgi:hypothetical protein
MKGVIFCMFLVLVCSSPGCGYHDKEEGPGGSCAQLIEEYNTCIPNFCVGKTCRLCQCWNDGYKFWETENDICIPMMEQMCQEALPYFDCRMIQDGYDYVCP